MGALLPWLAKIDPNTLIAILSTVGAFVWSHLSSKHRAVVTDVIAGSVKSILHEIADHVPTNVPIEQWLAGARRFVLEPPAPGQTPRIWVALGKAKIPRNATTEQLVRAAVEKATAELADKITAERRARALGVSPTT